MKLTRTELYLGGEREVVEYLAQRFVVHEPGFARVFGYDESALRNARGGVLVSSPPASPEETLAESAETQIGDAWTGDSYETQSKGESALTVRDGKGNPVAIITEVVLGDAEGGSGEVSHE